MPNVGSPAKPINEPSKISDQRSVSDVVVQLDLSIPTLAPSLAWGVQGWFVVRSKMTRSILVLRGIQRPEVSRKSML